MLVWFRSLFSIIFYLGVFSGIGYLLQVTFF
jgi:hypothetical protein